MDRVTKIAVRDIEMEVQETGQGGRGFVLVHGFTGSRDDFREQMAPLAEHGRTLALDQRGHGGTTNSGKHELYTLANLVADLKGAFDALGLERADLLGHSLGGGVVLRFALAHPERVASLVLMDTSPRPIKMRFSESARAGIAAFAREHGMVALAKRNREFAAKSDAIPPSAKRLEERMGPDVFWQRIERKHGQMDPIAWDALSAELGKAESVAERLGEIRCPTTVVVGAEDAPFLKPSDEMERGIRGARRVTIPDAAHSPQLENASAWLAAIRAHLDWARRRGAAAN
jgi:pimeloyl-ACP methyl ester carboxylesterase